MYAVLVPSGWIGWGEGVCVAESAGCRRVQARVLLPSVVGWFFFLLCAYLLG